MVIWYVIAIGVILFFGFPLIALIFIRKTKKSDEEQDKPGSYSELKASLLFLQMAFPTILFLLGALGYGTYEIIIHKVTSSVQAKVDTLIEKEKIVEWTKQIEDYRVKAESNANLITAITTIAQDSISRIVNQSFLKLLPKGTIIPFQGNRDQIDFEHWAICDGTKGTPDLRGRFILGSNFAQQNKRGGTLSHTHVASTIPRGQISKRQALDYKHWDGTTREFYVERHEHSFNGTESPVTVAKSEHLPPFYRLVFLMKIK